SIVTATADAMSAWRGFILAPSGIAASLATPRPAGWAPRSAAATGCVTHDHKVPHRPSHAQRRDLPESGVSPSPILTLRGDHGVGPDRPGPGGSSLASRARWCDIRHP